MKTKQIFILLAPGFDDLSVVLCLSHMRAAGLPVQLVGLGSGLLSSLRGLTIRPDYSLSEAEQTLSTHTNHMVILPGEQECVAQLLSDPRVHHFIETTLNQEGVIAAMSSAQSSLAQMNISLDWASYHQFLGQNDDDTPVFVQHLINYYYNHMN